MRTLLSSIQRPFAGVLEIGCGTGKNSEYLATRVQQGAGRGFLAENHDPAQAKVAAENVRFQYADVTEPWEFTDQRFDLATFSLVLEHVEDLTFAFEQAAAKLKPGGVLYLSELHHFKQY